MECVAWALRTASGFTLGAPFAYSLLLLAILCWDSVILAPWYLWKRLTRGADSNAAPATGDSLPALVVIPTLLRKRDELTSLMSTVESVANNGYRGDLYIVVSIDGYASAPALYEELTAWATARVRRDRHWLFVTGTPQRRGKPMAIEQAVCHIEDLVRRQVMASFPPVYISTDADADLGPDALEFLVARLRRRHPITGWPARAVAGNLYIRGNEFWLGWRRFFTVQGQLSLQIAREYLCANVVRHNVRWLPMLGVPGVLYCTWSDIFRAAPRFMGYMRTLTLRHWVRWWLGFGPPTLAEAGAPPIPELVAGDTDDTVSAFIAVLTRVESGRFVFDPPRTPLHAFVALLRSLFWDRALRYEPRARVFTSSPTTIRALFKQRRRWNSSRIEVTGRFWPALWFHWSLGLPAAAILFFIGRYCVVGALIYLYLPLSLFKSSLATAFVLGYSTQCAAYTMLTLFALLINGEERLSRLLLALPLSPLYAIGFIYLASVVGATNDVLLFGNVTGFAPEATLIRGGSWRVALLFRIRRALHLAVRSVVRGDVPFGRFWFGWRETKWTPNGYEGWTSGKRPRAIVPPVSTWFRSQAPSETDAPASARGPR